MTTDIKPSQRLDVLATQRDDLRDEKRNLERELKDIEAALKCNEVDIIAILDELGVGKFAVGKMSFSISETLVGNVEDWEPVYEYVLKNNAFHLLQRRLSNAAYKELLDMGEAPEGIVPFTKRSLNFRKSN
jgi:hypothetical protein